MTVLLATPPPSAAQRSVHVEVATNLSGAVLFADTLRLGPVYDGTIIAVPSQTERLRLTPPSAENWSIEPVVSPLAAAPGDTVRIGLHFPYYYAVRSVPYGASVYAETSEGRKYLGETPLVYTQAEPLQGTLRVERPAYAGETRPLHDEIWNGYDLVLTPAAPTPETTHEVPWRPPTQRLTWVDYAALGVALGAGLVTVHYKFQADRLYDRYAETTDPLLRDDIKAYDVRAGVALGVMQAGVGYFALRLVLRD